MALNPTSGPTQSDLYVQQLAATNPQLYNTAFGNSNLVSKLGTNPAGILNNPAYGGFTVEQSLNIAQSAESLFQQGLPGSTLAQQLNQQSQLGFLQQQQQQQQQQILQQQAIAAGGGFPQAGFQTGGFPGAGGLVQQQGGLPPLGSGGIDLGGGPQAILQQLMSLLTGLLGSLQQGA